MRETKKGKRRKHILPSPHYTVMLNTALLFTMLLMMFDKINVGKSLISLLLMVHSLCY